MLDKKTQWRLQFIISVAFAVVIMALIYVAIKYALGIVFPFVVAFCLGAVLQSPAFRLEKLTHGKLKKKTAATILLVIVLLVLVVVVAFAGLSIVNYVKSFVAYLKSLFFDSFTLTSVRDRLVELTKPLSGSVRTLALKGINAGYNYLSDSAKLSALASGSAGSAVNIIKNIPAGLLTTVIAVVACFFITISWDSIKAFVLAQFKPSSRDIIRSSKHAFRDTIGHLVGAYFKLAGINFSEALVGLLILKLIGLYDIGFMPVVVVLVGLLGASLTLLPLIAYCLIVGKSWLALGLGVLYVIMICVTQYAQPKIVGKSIGLNPLVTLLAMYVGLKIFGVIGLILFPVAIIVLKALQDTGKIHIWNSVDTLEEAPEKECVTTK